MTATAMADLLLDARMNAKRIRWQDITVKNRAEAYAIQDATMARLGAAGGWKVGAKTPQDEPACAPLPAARLLPSGSKATGAFWCLRGVEVEVALRLGCDLDPHGELLPPEKIINAFDAIFPAIEVVETRLADWPDSTPLTKLADLQSHGALILGAPSAMLPAQLDLQTVEARLAFDGKTVAHTHGGNPANDVWRMLAWLALHCSQRGQPLRAGQIVTTGSCTGMLFAAEGERVQAELAGIGKVEMQF